MKEERSVIRIDLAEAYVQKDFHGKIISTLLHAEKVHPELSLRL